MCNVETTTTPNQLLNDLLECAENHELEVMRERVAKILGTEIITRLQMRFGNENDFGAHVDFQINDLKCSFFFSDDSSEIHLWVEGWDFVVPAYDGQGNLSCIPDQGVRFVTALREAVEEVLAKKAAKVV